MIPNTDVAWHLATAAVNCKPVEVRRFTAGLHHYVFEVRFAERAPVVLRIATEETRAAMAGALQLSRLLRPKGVPLPEIIDSGLCGQFPYLILERLPGVDLGEVVRDLSDSSLESIAAEVARAQSAVADTPSFGRYGYAVSPADAPYTNWSHILDDNLARSRARITSTGLFDISVVDKVAALVSAARNELDTLPSIPFLHDTTTKNVIVTPGGAFSGIVDVDELCFGDPRYVIALTLAALMVSGGPVHYVESWMDKGKHRNDQIFRLYVLLFIVDFMSEQGQTFNGNQLSSADDRQRLLELFAAVMGWFDHR